MATHLMPYTFSALGGPDIGSDFRADHHASTNLAWAGYAPYAEPAARSIKVQGLGRTLDVGIASERSDLESAYQMLAANYQARGYEAPSTKLLRYTPYHVLPDTITVVAKDRGRVVATLSLVPDTTLLGLPMECTYGEEIDKLRRRGHHMAEATSLADRDLSCREFILVFKTFIKLVMQYHVGRGGNSWVITVNPRHRSFYLKVLGFVPLGPRRSYPAVQDHPAEAFLLDADLMKARAPQMHEFVFGDPLPRSLLTPPTWSAEQVAYFGSHSTQADRRTIRDIGLWVKHFGSLPRWLEPSVSEHGRVEACGS
ncbi:MAG TPA: hypothetical protein VGZ22_19400 [Isosphaeraceae bacterium]|jgi:hypothetical protein|nr:hypothetical protein [Isosphaeraceae bacterium]